MDKPAERNYYQAIRAPPSTTEPPPITFPWVVNLYPHDQLLQNIIMAQITSSHVERGSPGFSTVPPSTIEPPPITFPWVANLYPHDQLLQNIIMAQITSSHVERGSPGFSTAPPSTIEPPPITFPWVANLYPHDQLLQNIIMAQITSSHVERGSPGFSTAVESTATGRTTAGKYEKYLEVDNNDDKNMKREEFIKIIDSLYSDLTVGDPNDMYEKGQMLSSGGQPKVYCATHKITNKKHAIKIYKLPENLNATLIRHICGEIYYLAKTHHENIVKSYECFIHDNELWIILEYVNGVCLKDLSSYIYLSESEIATIVKGLLEALQDIHSRGLVHRDVQTNNVHFATDGSVKLLDFGCCTKVTEELTYAVGSWFWSSPEMFFCKGYNEKTDIWSLGITILDITFGEVPYQDTDKVDEVVDLILKRDRPPYIKEDLSPEFNDFLDKCFE